MKLKSLNLKRGACILTEDPFVYVLKSKYRSERCDSCFNRLTILRPLQINFNRGKLMKCGGCNYVYYCDLLCQKNGWIDHKMECSNLKGLSNNLPDCARIIARIIVKLKNGGDMQRGYYSQTGYRKFRDLMSHYQEIKKDEKRLEHLESITIVLRKLLNPHLVPNENELLSIYGRVCINGFNILDSEMISIGTGIYLGVSIVDHSCKPNAVATFDGTKLILRLTADLTFQDWSQIRISYIDLINTRDDRRQELKNAYYFYCTCSKCIDAKEEEHMLSAACPNCGDCIFTLKEGKSKNECRNCGQIISDNFLQTHKEVTEFTREKLEEMKTVSYLDVLQMCLKKQEPLLHSLNIWYVKTLDAAFESAINMKKWNEALEYGIRLLSGFQLYNGDYHPLVGIVLMKIGKIELFLEKTTDALKHLKEASAILIVTHGENHSLYKDQLVPLLQQAHVILTNNLH